MSRSRSLGSTIVLLLVASAAIAQAAAPPPAAAVAEKLTITNAANAFEGAAEVPKMSILMSVIRSDPQMSSYLKKKGQVLTAFPTTNKATTAFLRQVGKWSGEALQSETFTRAVFDYMIVPGRMWTLAQLRAAAPMQLKTLGGEMLNVTKDAAALGGVLVNGHPIAEPNHAIKDKTAVLHLLDGVLIPPSQQQLVDRWTVTGGAAPPQAVGAGAGAGAGGEGAPVAGAGEGGASGILAEGLSPTGLAAARSQAEEAAARLAEVRRESGAEAAAPRAAAAAAALVAVLLAAL